MEDFEIFKRDPKHVIDRLLILRLRKKLCDVTIVANGKKFEVHALVLAYSSEYFENLFENKDSTSKEIRLENINTDTLQLLIDYCYTGTIKITEENANEIFKMATAFSMPEIIESSSKFLTKKLTVSTSLSVWLYARENNLEMLQKEAFKIIQNNFNEVSLSQEYLNLKYSEIRELLSSEKSIAPEKSIYDAVKNWVNHDNPARSNNLADLLAFVNLSCLPREVLFSESLKVCNSNGKCLLQFIKALELQLSNDVSNCFESTNLSVPSNTLMAVGSDDILQAKKIEIFDVLNNKWVEIKDIANDKTEFSVTLFNNKLMIIGGFVSPNAVDTVECVDLKFGSVESLPRMRHARSISSAVSYKDFVYVIGGYDLRAKSNVEMWDSKSRLWRYISPIAIPRFGCGAEILGNHIYVVGGYGSDYLSSTECYNLENKTWKLCADMNEARYAPGVAAVGNYLYAVCGGSSYGSLMTAEKYDPIIDRWTSIQSTEISRMSLGAGNFAGKLVIAGGRSDSEKLSTVQIYDEENGSWKSMPFLKNPRSNVYLVNIPMSLANEVLSNTSL